MFACLFVNAPQAVIGRRSTSGLLLSSFSFPPLLCACVRACVRAGGCASVCSQDGAPRSVSMAFKERPHPPYKGEIRKACLKLAMQLHPDKAGPEHTAAVQEIERAYDKLSDSMERATYDQELVESGSPDGLSTHAG